MVELSSGLEGRSNNPIALLVDALLRPEADIGGTGPSSITWQYHPDKAVSHVVIGRGKPGGVWQYMEPTLQTLSLGSWLELPVYSLEEWKRDRLSEEAWQSAGSDGREDAETVHSSRRRALVGEISRYYSDYVEKINLHENFLNHSSVDRVMSMGKSQDEIKSSSCSISPSPPSLVSPNSPTSVISRAPRCSFDTTELERLEDICSIWAQSDDCGIHCPLLEENCQKPGKHSLRWHLRGEQEPCNHCSRKGWKFCVFSEKLVLANGVGSKVRTLNVPGEGSDFVTHDMPVFIEKVRQLSVDSGYVSCPVSTVVVVGAGLSAADAILSAISKEFKVVHVFRRDPNDKGVVFNGIPEREYPGYGKVFDLMRGKTSDILYSRHPRSKVAEFSDSDRSVTVIDKEGYGHRYKGVAMVGIFIGADANLDFLPDRVTSELGVRKKLPIGGRNPVDVDSVNFVSQSIPSVYAIGSLTGDSFVRFGIGSAVGAAQHILGLN